MAERIKVAVRLRPMTEPELEKLQQGTASRAVFVSKNSTTVQVPGLEPFSVMCDVSYGYDSNSDEYATQERIYEGIGKPIIHAALEGYNGTVFAFGQTGSGKSYSMLGYVTLPGLIPRALSELFDTKQQLQADSESELRIWISFYEVYNEYVRDLLTVGMATNVLQVVEHPRFGAYVDGLEEAPCETLADVQCLMDFGTKKRAVSSTQLTGTSARSHVFVCLRLERFRRRTLSSDRELYAEDDREAWRSKLEFIDCAGSERMLRERDVENLRVSRPGHAVSHSLNMLKQVVLDLRRNSRACSSASQDFLSIPPFRASKLCLLMKQALAGNCKTCMLAAVSPMSCDAEETYSTLLVAAYVKELSTMPLANRQTTQQLIKVLQAESQACQMQGIAGRLQEQILDQLLTPYEVARDQGMDMDRKRAQALRDMSPLGQDEPDRGGDVNNMTPYFINMSDDPTLRGALLYYIVPNRLTTVGSGEDRTIRLNGIGIAEELCAIENRDNMELIVRRGQAGRVVVRGRKLTEESSYAELKHGDRLFLGYAFGFKVVIPTHAAAEDVYPFEDLFLDSSFEDEWCAIEDSPHFASLRDYLEEQVMQQISEDQFTKLRDEVKLAVKACDEMNEVTTALRPTEGLYFEVDLTSAVPSSPVVRVCRWVGQVPEPLYIWSTRQAQERLDRMRDWYNAYLQPGGIGVGIYTHEFDDPWHEVPSAKVVQTLLRLQVACEDAAQENLRGGTVADHGQQIDGVDVGWAPPSEFAAVSPTRSGDGGAGARGSQSRRRAVAASVSAPAVVPAKQKTARTGSAGRTGQATPGSMQLPPWGSPCARTAIRKAAAATPAPGARTPAGASQRGAAATMRGNSAGSSCARPAMATKGCSRGTSPAKGSRTPPPPVPGATGGSAAAPANSSALAPAVDGDTSSKAVPPCEDHDEEHCEELPEEKSQEQLLSDPEWTAHGNCSSQRSRAESCGKSCCGKANMIEAPHGAGSELAASTVRSGAVGHLSGLDGTVSPRPPPTLEAPFGSARGSTPCAPPPTAVAVGGDVADEVACTSHPSSTIDPAWLQKQLDEAREHCHNLERQLSEYRSRDVANIGRGARPSAAERQMRWPYADEGCGAAHRGIVVTTPVSASSSCTAPPGGAARQHWLRHAPSEAVPSISPCSVPIGGICSGRALPSRSPPKDRKHGSSWPSFQFGSPLETASYSVPSGDGRFSPPTRMIAPAPMMVAAAMPGQQSSPVSGTSRHVSSPTPQQARQHGGSCVVMQPRASSMVDLQMPASVGQMSPIPTYRSSSSATGRPGSNAAFSRTSPRSMARISAPVVRPPPGYAYEVGCAASSSHAGASSPSAQQPPSGLAAVPAVLPWSPVASEVSRPVNVQNVLYLSPQRARVGPTASTQSTPDRLPQVVAGPWQPPRTVQPV